MPDDLEPRLAAVERRVDEARTDAAAARQLAAARDRDLADLTIKVDSHRKLINALSIQTAGGFAEMRVKFEQVDARFEQVDARIASLEGVVATGFAEMRAKFDQTAAGMQLIVDLLTPGPGTAQA